MPSKRRKGKQAVNRSSTSSSPSGNETPTLPLVSTSSTSSRTKTTDLVAGSSTSQHNSSFSNEPQLVLTSDKRRGVYECDYCHADISQVPRIRCAVCPDFDLCLDCFANPNVNMTNQSSSMRNRQSQDAGSMSNHHSLLHPYKVADSTRYPMFPSTRAISKESSGNNTNDIIDGMDDIEMEDIKDSDSASVQSTLQVQDDKSNASIQDNGNSEKATEEKLDEPLLSPPSVTKDSNNTDLEESKDSSLAIERSSSSINELDLGFIVQEDPKTLWTVEEDLRLLDAISTCGLGNWVDISEAIGGQGSIGKTPKRCMERYFDDFLGRYGHILPAYTIMEEDDDALDLGEEERPSEIESEPKKRRVERMSSFGVVGLSHGRRGKKLKATPTASLPSYNSIWPDPYVPPIPNAKYGQEVGREQRYRAEQLYVKLITNAASFEEAEAIRKEWKEKRLNQPDGPTALPMRPEDLVTLPGSDLAGFMPRRGDFDTEWDNEAEEILAGMEFSVSDSPHDRELKIKVIQIYNGKLDERERRKNFLLSRGLMDYRKKQQEEATLPRDERDLVRRMRLFERLHTPEEHQKFIDDILKAKQLRKEIAKLQMYRRIGIRTLAEAEKYENDKYRREIHKIAYMQKVADADKVPSITTVADTPTLVPGQDEDDISSSLWKQYKTTDRKNRRSVNRSSSNLSASSMEQLKVNLNPDNDDIEQTEEQDRKELFPNVNDDADKVENLNMIVGNQSLSKAQTLEENGDTPDVRSEQNHPQSTNVSSESDKIEVNGCDSEEFNIYGLSGYDMLSPKEVDLCQELKLQPKLYLQAKTALIQESFMIGLLDRDDSSERTVVTIDVKKRGNVINFMVKAGWISSKVSETVLGGGDKGN